MGTVIQISTNMIEYGVPEIPANLEIPINNLGQLLLG